MPTWNMVARPISTADNGSAIPTISQRWRLPTTKPKSQIEGAGLGIIFYDSIFAALSLELWADSAGAPAVLLATSINSWTKAEIDAAYPLDYKFLWLGFQFTPYPLRPGAWYHFALRATGYTGDATNHIAWRHAYPDAQYRAGWGAVIETINAGVVPLEALVFAADL